VKLKETNGKIEALDNRWMFMHFLSGQNELFSEPWNWKFIEQMCAAHNEPFERVR